MKSSDLWISELELLHNVILKTGLVPEKKWGGTVFTYQGKNIVSYGGFKEYFCLWFFNGVFLVDNEKVLINAQEGKTKALRQWRFSSIDEVNEKLIMKYVMEAIENEKNGIVWKPQKTQKFEIPSLLNEALKRDNVLHSAFDKLTQARKNEFIEYLESAKRESTKLERLKKIIPMIIGGKGLNDKYK